MKIEETRAKDNSKLADDLNRQASAGPGIREFVRHSLLDIMGGVDDAATFGRTRELNDGLSGYLPFVTRIGAAPGAGNGSDRVEFDLAVTVAQSTSEGEVGSGGLDAGFKLGVMGWGKLHVGASGKLERTLGETTSSQQANRLRFSVPISYAVQDDSEEDE